MRTAGFLTAADAHQSDAIQLRYLRRQTRIDHIFHLGKRHGIRSHRQREHGRIGGIGLGVNRRRGQIGRQIALRGVDGSLHFLFRDVDVKAQIELQHDHRRGAGTGRSHLAETLHLAKLTLQRRGDRGRHYVRAGAGIKRHDLNGRIIHLRQRGDRQLRIRDDPHQHDGDHEQ